MRTPLRPILALCLALAGSALAADPDEVAEKLLSTDPDKADMALVTPALRGGVIKHLGVTVEGLDPTRGKRALIYLLRLDNPLAVSTVMMMFEDFQKPAALGLHSIVYQGRQPLLIPKLAPALSSREKSKALLYDQVSSRKDENAADLILATISSSPVFSRELRDWADAWEERGPSDSLPQVRTWWELNKEVLAKGDYGKARPLSHGKLAAERTEAYRKLVSGNSENADVSAVPAGERAGVIEALREDLESSKYSFGNEIKCDNARIFLVQLGDQKAIAEMVGTLEFYPGNGNRSSILSMEEVVKRTDQPAFIPWLATYLSSTKPAPESRCVIYESPANHVARLIAAIIKKSPAFTKEVKEWLAGKSMNGLYDHEDIEALWEQNKDALHAGKYGEVKPPKSGG